jgi:hypothetical protein
MILHPPPLPCPRCKAPMGTRTEQSEDPGAPTSAARLVRWFTCGPCSREYETCLCCFRGAMYEEPRWSDREAVHVRCVGGCGHGKWRQRS